MFHTLYGHIWACFKKLDICKRWDGGQGVWRFIEKSDFKELGFMKKPINRGDFLKRRGLDSLQI